jgi:hypothetical protein
VKQGQGQLGAGLHANCCCQTTKGITTCKAIDRPRGSSSRGSVNFPKRLKICAATFESLANFVTHQRVIRGHRRQLIDKKTRKQQTIISY